MGGEIEKMNKKRVSLFAVIIMGLLIATVVAVLLQNSGITPKATIGIAYGAGTPDALGNRISTVYFQQNSTGQWSTVGILGYANYVLNYNLTIPANQHTIIRIDVHLNISLAPDVATAAMRVKVYLTISGVVTSASMTYVGGFSAGDHWTLELGWPSASFPPPSTWIPATDTTYTLTFQYQAYY